MSNKLTTLLAGAVITGLIAGSVAKAEDTVGNSQSGQDQQVSGDKNNCKGKVKSKDSCTGKAAMANKKKDKNSCSGKNGCEGKDGEKKQ